MTRSAVPIIGAVLVAGVWVGCTDRSSAPTDFARLVAEHFCPVQSSCDCDEVPPVGDCYASVQRLVAGWEQEAIAGGLELNEVCLEALLDEIDAYPACVRLGGVPPCPVYAGKQEHGEACRSYEYGELVSDCRPGLRCAGGGVCRDLLNPPALALGERCSEKAGVFAVGVYGECEEPLTCDLSDTLTCVPTLAAGEVCTGETFCREGTYCRTVDPDDSPSPQTPGVCEPRTTQPGEPCTHRGECTTFCDPPGICSVRPPNVCERLKDFHLFLGDAG